MFLSAAQIRALSGVMVTLAEPHGEAEVRRRVGAQLLELLQADYYASYVWDPAQAVFGNPMVMDDGRAGVAHRPPHHTCQGVRGLQFTAYR